MDRKIPKLLLITLVACVCLSWAGAGNPAHANETDKPITPQEWSSPSGNLDKVVGYFFGDGVIDFHGPDYGRLSFYHNRLCEGAERKTCSRYRRSDYLISPVEKTVSYLFSESFPVAEFEKFILNFEQKIDDIDGFLGKQGTSGFFTHETFALDGGVALKVQYSLVTYFPNGKDMPTWDQGTSGRLIFESPSGEEFGRVELGPLSLVQVFKTKETYRDWRYVQLVMTSCNLAGCASELAVYQYRNPG